MLNKKFERATDDTIIWLSDLTCQPCGSSLYDCSFQELGNINCTHTQDLAVSCYVPQGKTNRISTVIFIKINTTYNYCMLR